MESSREWGERTICVKCPAWLPDWGCLHRVIGHNQEYRNTKGRYREPWEKTT